MNIEESKKIDEMYLKCGFALKMLETELAIVLENYIYKNNYNPIEHIKSRLKSKESTFKKLKKKNLEINSSNILNNIHDVIGIRIICSFLSDVYDIVNLIKNSKQFKIKEEKDYITNPKDTGYISYHMLLVVPLHLDDKVEYVNAEIQIRTIAMDFWASLDHKLRYKFPKDVPNEINDEIYNCSIDIKKLDEKMNELNNKISKYKDE